MNADDRAAVEAKHRAQAPLINRMPRPEQRGDPDTEYETWLDWKEEQDRIDAATTQEKNHATG